MRILSAELAAFVICSLLVGSLQQDPEPSGAEDVPTEAATEDVQTEADTETTEKIHMSGTLEPEATTTTEGTFTITEEVPVTEGSTSTTAEQPVATEAPPQTQTPTGEEDYPFVERFDDQPPKAEAASELLTHSAVVPLILMLLGAL